jgi:cation:H+ antiporter|nr:calcium/sodium antiporter [Neorhizobium tomejilense]
MASYDTFIIAVGSLVFGLYVLLKSSDILVKSSSFVARRFGLSEFFIGATIVAFGTSAPELFISVNANLGGSPGVALGNVVGSNTVNIMVILAVTAVVFPLVFSQTMLLRDVTVMVVASVLLSALILWGEFGLWAGIAMLAVLLGYVFWQYLEDAPEADRRTAVHAEKESVARHLATIAACLGVLVIGTEFLVKGAIVAGATVGIPETFVAMTIVAVGTSFPELATSFLAAIRGKGDMVIGNILGSNIFNILAIMGVTSTLAPVRATGTVDLGDLGMFIGSAFALLAAVWLKGIPRWVGGVLLVAYALYVFVSTQNFA